MLRVVADVRRVRVGDSRVMPLPASSGAAPNVTVAHAGPEVAPLPQ